MRPRFQADANLNQDILVGLRRREPGVDFQSAQEAGLMRLSDPLVLAKAAEQGRILVTHDRKTIPMYFAAMIRERESPGVLIVAQSPNIGAVIEELLLIWRASEAEEWRNILEYIPM